MKLDTTAALISLAEAKEYLGVQSDTQEEIIQLFLNAVGVWVNGYLGRESLLAKDYTEYYSGHGGKHLMVRNYPIISVTSIHDDSLRQWAAGSALSVATDVMVNKAGGILTLWNNESYWTPGTANLKIVYRAGYELTSMPHDIRMAVKRIIDHQFRHGYTSRKMDLSSETIGEQTTSFRENDIPKDAKSMLARYMKNDHATQFEYAD